MAEDVPSNPAPPAPKSNPIVRACVDYAGAAAFLIGYLITRDVVKASWWLVVGSAAALMVGFVAERRIAPIPLLSGGAALVFGTLTLVFHDKYFLFIKPTALNLAFAVALLGGFAIGKSPIRILMGEALKLSDGAWRRLTLRYGLFFLAMALLNEAVWRTQPEKVWVLFKFPGMTVLTLLFSFTQIPGILKDAAATEDAVTMVETQAD